MMTPEEREARARDLYEALQEATGYRIAAALVNLDDGTQKLTTMFVPIANWQPDNSEETDEQPSAPSTE
jgi:hypothetical protein